MTSIARFLRKSWAFIRRDFQIESSYKLDFLMTLGGSLLPLVLFYFISKLVAVDAASQLSRYGGRFLPFVIVGLAFARYFQLMLRQFSESVRVAQMTGCLETMLSSQTNPIPIVVMSSFYSLISGFVQMALMLLAAVVAFGVDLRQANVGATLVVFAVSVLPFIAFGVLSAAIIVLIKRGDPVTWLFSMLGALLGGAYFPLSVMPPWMQKIAAIIPITYSLDALRLTLLRGYTLAQVRPQLLLLGIMGAILLPLSTLAFGLAVRKGRRDGSLMQY